MYVKSIILDGFKSYGQRTEINGFDPQFNAITGLNGSGKSNILDAICFVMGITNLSHVRASNLQDLIFKSGQSGINKATVSIIFDNTNPEQCPPGFEDINEITVSRQIVMGGKNKYFINGITVPNKKVQDMFCSIQLNVNNPHFLIMQGKITKVINMKPSEILAMVEEAAGTRMFEVKRQEALRLIEKKEAKLGEINTIMEEELGPKLIKLREEKQQYLEYQQTEKEIDKLMGLYQFWRYCNSRRITEKAKEDLEKGTSQITDLEAKIEQNLNKVTELEKEIEDISKNATTEDTANLQEMEKELNEKERTEAKVNATLHTILDNISTEKTKKSNLEKQLKTDTLNLQKKEQELDEVQNLFETLKSNDEKDAEAYTLSQKKFEAISVGMEINDEGESQTLQDQLMKAREEAAKANTEIKQSQMRLNFCENQLKEKQNELLNSSNDEGKDRNMLMQKENQIKTLESKIKRMSFSEEKMQQIEERRRNLTQEVQKLKQQIENFECRKPYVNFKYTDPEPNFNKNCVKNTVCRLFKVIDDKNSVALETVAGGRLYNVVIDTENTGKKLLKFGNLSQRTTFIPLNKIKGNKMNQAVVNIAQQLVGPENCQPALSLIKYPKEVESAMEFIFGNTFICKNMSIAKTVTFHDRIMKRCVTLDGDVTDPSGTLSGGSAYKGDPVLREIARIMECEKTLKGLEQELNDIESEAGKIKNSYETYTVLKQEHELASHELNLVKKRLQQSKYYLLKEEVEKYKNEISQLKDVIATCKESEAKHNKKAKEFEDKLKDSKGYMEKQLKQVQKEMKELKLKADKSHKLWKEKEQHYESLKMEIIELKKDLENTKRLIEESDEAIKNFENKHEEEIKNTEGIKEETRRLKEQIKSLKLVIANKSKDIKKKNDEKEKILAKNNDIKLKIKEITHDIKNLENNYKNALSKEQDLRKKLNLNDPNLKKAEELPQKEGNDMERRIKVLQDKKTKLGRIVNTKAQSILDIEEKKYQELNKKQKILHNDKEQLLVTLKDVEKQKKKALTLAYEQITKDFGSMFGMLLPRSNAKLVAIFSGNVIQGLEIKVSLGDIWKENLSELSGGQKSLVALSLILAMLVFKPAPLYILDEVDAALDLSHTQNIGSVIKTHFNSSQFIVVSLKDGMFNNANVLFRTKFVDGNSSVTRSSRI